MANKDGKEVHKNIQLRFIGSWRFMSFLLDNLASNLDDDQCKNFSEFYKREEVFKLMRRNGVYPYQCISVYGWLREV